MISFENQCVGCSSMGLPCLGRSCPNSEVPCYSCDDCGDELAEDEAYMDPEDEDRQLCSYCLLKKYRIEF